MRFKISYIKPNIFPQVNKKKPTKIMKHTTGIHFQNKIIFFVE